MKTALTLIASLGLAATLAAQDRVRPAAITAPAPVAVEARPARSLDKLQLYEITVRMAWETTADPSGRIEFQFRPVDAAGQSVEGIQPVVIQTGDLPEALKDLPRLKAAIDALAALAATDLRAWIAARNAAPTPPE